MPWKELKMKSLSFSLLLALLISCSSDEIRNTESDGAYRTSGVEQFFLPELPGWANYSSAGKCFKTSSFQYLDFAKIHSSYDLSYQQLVELQGQYNQKREDYFRSTAYRFLKPVEEAAFFSNTLEQVRGGVRSFNLPQVKEIDLIWLEGYLQNDELTGLVNQLKLAKNSEHLPLLFSSCLSHQRLEQWLIENGLENEGIYLLSADWLNPYGLDKKLKAGLHLELSTLLPTGAKFHVISPQIKTIPEVN